jgi:predicted house-cleaning noncanonical NTP pyrophosphatase (MazG superfamily)
LQAAACGSHRDPHSPAAVRLLFGAYKVNASKHKALSWEYANRLEAQLKQEVEELMHRAKEEIQARAQERFEREQSAFEAKQAKCEAREKQTGKKPPGKGPTPPTSGPRAKDQVNLTDEESRIMPTASGGFEQAYNAQAGVDVETYLIVEQHVTQHTNDKQEIEPSLEAIGQANVERCTAARLVPSIPEKRERHNLPLTERFREDPEPPQDATAVQAMRHRLQTRDGKAVYATRKSTVETVFGIIKQVQGFRQFLLRGLDSVQSEWSLVCIGWNLKRMHALRG